MEYHSATKKNAVLPFATMCLDLESIMLSKISQSKKDKYHMILLIGGIQETKKKKGKQTLSYSEQTGWLPEGR